VLLETDGPLGGGDPLALGLGLGPVGR